MDEHLRLLERAAQNPDDPEAHRNYNAARERAGLPITLEALFDKWKNFDTEMHASIRRSLIFTLSDYMKKYGDIVEHVTWQQTSPRDIGEFWVGDVIVRFTMKWRIQIFDETPSFNTYSALESGGLCCEEDTNAFTIFVSNKPQFQPVAKLMEGALKEGQLLARNLRNLKDYVHNALGLTRVVFDSTLNLLTMSEKEYQDFLDVLDDRSIIL